MTFLTRDVWVGLVMLVVAGVYWLEADKIRISPLDGPVGAAGLPKTLAYALGILAIVLIVHSIAGAVMSKPAPADPPAEDAGSARERMLPHLRAVGMLVIGVAYLLLISWLGYALTVMLLIFAVSLFIGAPLGLRIVLVSIGGGIMFHLLFVEFLDISLPPGDLIGALPGIGG